MTKWKAIKKYAIGVGLGAALATEIFGCTLNMAKPNFAISVGADVSDVSVDPQTREAGTKYPNKPATVIGGGYFNNGYSGNYGNYNTWPPVSSPGCWHNNSDVGSTNGPVFRSRFQQ
jgi:hypothetical protein